jgi:hypothetical protein
MAPSMAAMKAALWVVMRVGLLAAQLAVRKV